MSNKDKRAVDGPTAEIGPPHKAFPMVQKGRTKQVTRVISEGETLGVLYS